MTDITELAQSLKAAATNVKETAHIARYLKATIARQTFKELMTPDNILALVEALEYYKSREERVTSLVRDNSKSWDELYRQVEAKGKRNVELVEALEKAQQRISQLESRTVTVKLPEPFKLAKSSSGLTYYYADEVNEALTEHGIKVEA
ncbi:ead/Ea22-like family protein [Klebsiella pneumoniae]|uniref:ead/Ea22-like family protein n=1 Tax=Klebsiella pneumoniae TaxID=573 RepID=UPI00385267E6